MLSIGLECDCEYMSRATSVKDYRLVLLNGQRHSITAWSCYTPVFVDDILTNGTQFVGFEEWKKDVFRFTLPHEHVSLSSIWFVRALPRIFGAYSQVFGSQLVTCWSRRQPTSPTFPPSWHAFPYPRICQCSSYLGSRTRFTTSVQSALDPLATSPHKMFSRVRSNSGRMYACISSPKHVTFTRMRRPGVLALPTCLAAAQMVHIASSILAMPSDTYRHVPRLTTDRHLHKSYRIPGEVLC